HAGKHEEQAVRRSQRKTPHPTLSPYEGERVTVSLVLEQSQFLGFPMMSDHPSNRPVNPSGIARPWAQQLPHADAWEISNSSGLLGTAAPGDGRTPVVSR